MNIDIKVGDKLFSKISKELIEKNKYYKINTITDSANKIFEKIFEKNIEIKISIFVMNIIYGTISILQMS